MINEVTPSAELDSMLGELERTVPADHQPVKATCVNKWIYCG